MRIRTFDDLTDWKERIPRLLDELRAMLQDPAFAGDLSVASLDPLDAFLMQSFGKSADILKKEAAPVHDAAAAYIGEVYLRNIGSEWDWEMVYPENHMYYGWPVVESIEVATLMVCPHGSVMSRLNQRTDMTLRKAYEKIKQYHDREVQRP